MVDVVMVEVGDEAVGGRAGCEVFSSGLRASGGAGSMRKVERDVPGRLGDNELRHIRDRKLWLFNACTQHAASRYVIAAVASQGS